MSRCFPFPPPGYERKHRVQDLLELKEAKLKEKKDRKEKKRKDREKREKDGNREKSGDKKDRKEKHREKKEKNRNKKDDNKEKEEEKTSALHDLIVSSIPEQRTDKELHREGYDHDGSSYTGVNKHPTFLHCRNGVKPFGYGVSQTTLEAKFVEELNKRIEEDGEISEDQFCGRVAIMENGRQEGKTELAVVRNHSMEVVGEKGNSRHKGVQFRNMKSELPRDELTRKPMAQNHVKLSDGKVDGNPSAIKGQNCLSFVDKQKSNRADSDTSREELGGRDMEIHERDIDKGNDRKLEEKKSKNSEIRYSSDATATGHKNDGFSQGVEDAKLGQGNSRKRKDIISNGFVHDTEARPYKSQVQTIHHFPENGRKPVASQVFSKTSDNVPIPGSVQLDDSNLSMKTTVQPLNALHSTHNAFTDVMGNIQISPDPKDRRQDTGSASEKLSVPMVEDLLAEASRRPPHPDAKYLGRVLRVPDMGQWSECDDQEWLFSKKDPPLHRNPVSEPSRPLGETHVWSTAVRIESAHVYALPYVIPH